MKFTAKELISVGIFTTVYTVIYMIFNLVGAIAPMAQLFGGLFSVVINGVVYMLFLTRVRHFGLITLFAVILGVLMTLAGHHPVSILTALIAGLSADFVASRGDFRETRSAVLSYGLFTLWVIGAYLPLLFMRNDLIAEYRDQMGAEWADAFNSLFSPGMVFALILLTFAAGLAGGAVGRRALGRHFQRAGLA